MIARLFRRRPRAAKPGEECRPVSAADVAVGRLADECTSTEAILADHLDAVLGLDDFEVDEDVTVERALKHRLDRWVA